MARTKRILCYDIGGTGLKAAIIGGDGRFLTDKVRVLTPKKRRPRDIVPMLVALARPLGRFDHVTIGFPGVVKRGHVISAPAFGTGDWQGFPLAAEMKTCLKKPVKLLNDADVQGLAVIRGKGLELVCTLGTGFGTAWFRDGELMPHMDLAHLTLHRKYDFDVLVGDATLKRIGKHRWRKRVKKLVEVLKTVFSYDHLYLGGGNARLIEFTLPPDVTVVSNDAGMEGGAFAWTRHKTDTAV